jgi:hypothetical protein
LVLTKEDLITIIRSKSFPLRVTGWLVELMAYASLVVYCTDRGSTPKAPGNLSIIYYILKAQYIYLKETLRESTSSYIFLTGRSKLYDQDLTKNYVIILFARTVYVSKKT